MYGITSSKRYEPIVCKDGFEMSVQAGGGMYSHPRYDATSYTEVEIGFPNKEEPLLAAYAEDPERPTGTVYPYVPAKLVLEVIEKHGGMVSGELPPFEDKPEPEQTATVCIADGVWEMLGLKSPRKVVQEPTTEELFMHFVSDL